MVHPTRTNLLLLKEKARSVTGSVAILRARRLALMREFLTISAPFLASRDQVRTAYARGLVELQLSLGHEGEEVVESLEAVTGRELGVELAERSVMGLSYRDLTVREEPLRSPQERGYDWRATNPHLEEAIHLFETILAQMLEIAALESRMKRIGDEIARVTRRARILEERVLPALKREIRGVAQYLGERDRESYYRLKRFKEIISAP